jgi:hypothetical protein
MTEPTSDRCANRLRYGAQIEECRCLVSDFVDAAFPQFFEQADVALMEFAQRAESNAVQGRFFEAIEQLRRRRSDVVHIYHQELNAGFENFGTARAGTRGAVTGSRRAEDTELSLVDPDDMEESVAAENLISRANANYFPELYALSERLSVVAGGRKLKDFEIPAGPHHLVDAFRRALDGLDVEVKVKVILYALLDKVLIRDGRQIYDGCNDVLKRAGILPNLKLVRIRSSSGESSGPERPRQGAPDSAETEEGTATPAAAVPGRQTDLGTDLFQSILDLMATRRPQKERWADPRDRFGPGGGDRPMPAPEGLAAATEKLLSALNRVQARHAVGSSLPASQATAAGAVQEWALAPLVAGRGSGAAGTPESLPTADYANVALDAPFLDRVRMVLAQERQEVLGQTDPEDLSPVDADIIDLVGMLFEYMLNDPVLPDSAKALLSHLHTPYLKVGLMDRSLLVDSSHPARRLLDSMVDAGSLWVDDNNPARGIFPIMQQTVDRVLKEFANDVGLFDELVRNFGQAMQEQRRLTDATEQSTQDAARGREKLQLSKQSAARQIQTLTPRHPLPKALSHFLETTWLDHLVFVLLREEAGEASGAWREAVATAERLVALFDPAASPAERRSRIAAVPQLRASVLERVERMGGYSRASVDALGALLADPGAWTADDRQSTPEAAPKMRRPAATRVVEPVGLPQDDTRTNVPVTAQHKEMIERLTKMSFGTWFEFAPEQGCTPRRIKLSWISPLTSMCMFVDRSGMQAEIKTLNELAQEVLAHRAKVIPRPVHPFIDRALLSIRKMLQRDTGDGTKPVAG